MKVLVACEFSGVVRDAFKAMGHDAWSCDILPTEVPGQHILNDVRNVLDAGWDLMIAHPPCTYSSYMGARWFKTDPDRERKMFESFKLFDVLWNAPIERIAIENPRGWVMKYWRKPDDLIQPYQFGESATKATCFWLKNLSPLMTTMIVTDPLRNWTKNKRGSHNGHARSRTFQGIANAMAAQWGN